MTQAKLTQELRDEITATIGLPADRVLMDVSGRYPECVLMVTLGDPGPQIMIRVCDVLRREGNCEWRLVANVIEEKDIGGFSEMSFAEAWHLSWERCIATTRMG